MTTSTDGATSPLATIHRARVRRGASDRLSSWLVFGVVLLATVLQQPAAGFRFDARGYWNASGALLGVTESPEGFWDLRGVASSAVFVPARLVAQALGADGAGFAVLVQNSLLIAALAAFVAPAVLRPWAVAGPGARWTMAVAVALVARGFAPYPLVDLYAATAVLLAVCLLYRQSWASLTTAGLLLGAAFNIRPAYLVAALLAAVVAVLHHRLRAVLVGLGALAALVPQTIYVAVAHHTFGVTPTGTALIGIQASYAAYTVRYDTIIAADVPQQFFCSPEMAGRITEPPTTIGSLAETFVTTLPHSAVFALEKLGAALHWPLSIPYLAPHPGVNALVAVLVTATAVVGCIRLLSLPVRAGSARIARPLVSALLLGTVVTLIGAALEARFALLVVLIGAIGLGALIERPPVLHRPGTDLWLAAAAVVTTVVLLVAGWAGLSHPAVPGGVTLESCAEQLP